MHDSYWNEVEATEPAKGMAHGLTKVNPNHKQIKIDASNKGGEVTLGKKGGAIFYAQGGTLPSLSETKAIRGKRIQDG